MTDKKDKKPEASKEKTENKEVTQEQMDKIMASVLLNFPFDNYAKMMTNILETFEDPKAKAEFKKHIEKGVLNK